MNLAVFRYYIFFCGLEVWGSNIFLSHLLTTENISDYNYKYIMDKYKNINKNCTLTLYYPGNDKKNKSKNEEIKK